MAGCFVQTTQGVSLGAIWVMSGHERKKSRHYPGVGFYEGRRAETPYIYISLYIWPAKSSPLHQPRTKLYDFQIWINISTSFFGGWARINIHLHHWLYHSYFDHQEHGVLTSAGSPWFTRSIRTDHISYNTCMDACARSSHWAEALCFLRRATALWDFYDMLTCDKRPDNNNRCVSM